MHTTSEQLTYRLYEERDRQALLQLWEEESGWGAISSAQFDSWFLNTPYGKCVIVVAENEDEAIVGQIIYTPSRMIMDGKEIKTVRASSPILSSSSRQANIRDYNHPAFTLMRAGFDLAGAAGYQYVYGFPAYGWLGLLRLFPRMLPNPSDTASYNCFAISLAEPLNFNVNEAEYKVVIAGTLTPEYDELWNSAITAMPIKTGIARRSTWLQYALGANLVLETRSVKDDSLLGYMAINKQSGLLVDVFAKDTTDLEKVFQHCLHSLNVNNDGKIPVAFTKLKGMLTDITEPIVAKIGYETDPFRFAFGSYLLDTSLSFEKLAVTNWYMTPLG
ncbi:MAG: hypothetical protein ABIN94_00360 [Ferruginibacter sp.]